MQPHSVTRSFLQTAIVLGLLMAIGPFAIDMYLPALPTIGRTLNATPGAVQASLMAFFVALGVGQVFYGPLSDMLGRKIPLYFGVGLFGVGSVGCALASDIETLVALRFVQGLGACVGMVVPRAVVRDLHTGAEATRLMAMLLLVFSVSPILAPLAGSLLIDVAGWRSVFWAVTAIALLLLALLATALPETRPPAQRVTSTLRSAMAAYALLLRDRHFLGLVFIGAFGSSSFFAYLANSPFVMIDHFGLTPRQYSLVFALNAAAYIGAAQYAAALSLRFGQLALVRIATTGFAFTMLLLLALHLLGVDRLDVMVILLLLGFGCYGLASPALSVLALDPHGPIAGTASALMGTLQFVTGAVVMAVIGFFVDGSARPMLLGIAGCASLALVLTLRTLGLRTLPHQPS